MIAMTTLEFLQRVLPSEVTMFQLLYREGRQQGFFDSVEELASVCERLDKTNNNTYFAISAFNAKGIETR